MRTPSSSLQLGKAIAAVFLMMLFILPVSASVQTKTAVSQPQHTAYESTIYVNWNNTLGPWDGSLEHPYQYIQDGIDNACHGDTVFVFHGIYDESIVIYVCGIDVVGERRSDTVIDGQGYGTCVRFTADYSSLSNFTIESSGWQGNDSAITLNGRHCTVAKNNIRDSYCGVYALDHCNSIYYNNFIDNGVHAYSTDWNFWDDGCGGGNYWSGFARIDANEDGIIDTPYDVPGGPGQDCYPLLHPYGSVVNLNTTGVFFCIAAAIADDCTTDGNVISVAMDTYWEHLCIDKELTIQGENRTQTLIDGRFNQTVVRILAANVTLQGFTILNSGTPEPYCGVSVENRDATLTDLLVQDNYHGIVLQDNSSGDIISCCTVCSNSWNGIYIGPGCPENLIDTCIIKENAYCGLMIYQASYNTVYHNSFLDNHLQAFDSGFNIWDNGYPSGGNTWSNYKGKDANHDGIGDTPYNVSGGVDQDRYPLIHAYHDGDTTPPYVRIVSPKSGLYILGHRHLGWVFRHSIIVYGKLTVQVNAVDVQSGIKEVRFYLDKNSMPQSVVTQSPYTWTWTKPLWMPQTHVITVVTFDNAGNYNMTSFSVRRWM